MIEELIDSLKNGSFFDKIISLVVVLTISFVVLLFCYGVFVSADSWFIEEQIGIAEVCGKDYTPAWVQFIYHADGNGGGWTQVIPHPEMFYIVLKINNLSDAVIVQQKDYNDSSLGKQLSVSFRKGRFSKSLYITKAHFN